MGGVGIELVNIEGDGESMGAEGGVSSASETAGRAGGGLLVVRYGNGDGMVRSGDRLRLRVALYSSNGLFYRASSWYTLYLP